LDLPKAKLSLLHLQCLVAYFPLSKVLSWKIHHKVNVLAYNNFMKLWIANFVGLLNIIISRKNGSFNSRTQFPTFVFQYMDVIYV
jgi:hypothetical protein